MILCARELSSRRLPLRFGLCYLQKREQSRLPAISKFENDLFNTFTKEHHHGMAQSCDDQQLFADSQFQMLKISEHGSLIQHEENTHDYLFNDQCMFDEEELNLRNTFQEKDTEINFIRNMPKYSRSKNPNETKPFRLIKLSNDATIESSSIDDFFCRVIGNEAAVKDYHYQMPVFPTELTNYSLKHYLRQVNVIDLNYDIHGFEKLIFFQILKICRNISRFDGILDIVVLHELIKFLGKYGMIRSIFKVIDAFEHLGIHPNKDTLHLLIYKLNDIKGLRWRKDLLNFYVLLGTRKWGVSPDKTTEVLSAIQSPPGRPRLAITKRLINEGIDDSYFQNTMFHDYVTIEIESRELPYFERFYHFLLKRKAITDTHENKIILFNMYIEKLASCCKLRHAIEEMKTHEELTTPDTYTALIDQTIKNNVWTGFALLNHLMSQGNVRVSDIGMAIIGNYRTIQENFTKQAQNVNRLHQHNMPQIYNIVIKMLLAKCGYQISGNNKFLLPVERDLPLDEETVISDFQKIQFWNLDTEYSHYNGLLTSRCGGSWIFKLWDVMDIESSPQDNLYINPITFPWR